MDKTEIEKIREELSLVSHLIEDVNSLSVKQALKVSVKRIRKELSALVKQPTQDIAQAPIDKGAIILKVLDQYVYNDENQAGVKLHVIDASDLPKIIPAIVENLSGTGVAQAPSDEEIKQGIIIKLKDRKSKIQAEYLKVTDEDEKQEFAIRNEEVNMAIKSVRDYKPEESKYKCIECESEINYKGVCDVCYTKEKSEEAFRCRNVACKEMTNRDNGTVFCDKHKPYLGI